MNDTYKVYMHISPSGKRYIGITCQKNINRRWQNGLGYRSQAKFYRAIQKYGWENFEHIIVLDGVSKEVAENIEIELIKKYDSRNPQKGYNVENGGNCFGTHSEETKRKIGLAQLGEKNHMYGKPSPARGRKATPKQIERNRLSHLGQIPWNKGKKMTDAQKKNIGRYIRTEEHIQKRIATLNKSVMCLETGVIYPSCKEAGLANGINRGSISNAALGKRKRAGAYHWKFVVNE